MKSRIILLLVSLVGSGPVVACTCMNGVTIGQKYDNAAHVFTAVVTQIKRVEITDALQHDNWLDSAGWQLDTRLLEGLVKVTSTFKGEPETIPAVYTHPQESACGFPLTRGDEFLFFADERGVVGLCSGSVGYSNRTWRSVIGDIRQHQRSVAQPTSPPRMERSTVD